MLAQPGAPFPLQRLAQLYRERDGNLKQLESDLEARAGGPAAEAWAARVALAGLLQEAGRADDALRAWTALAAERPKDPVPLAALARLHQARGETAEARSRWEQALPLLPGTDREAALRTLRTLALDAKDWDAAKKWHADLVKATGGSMFVRGELGRELESRGELKLAEAELRALVAGAAGDNRTLAPALRDLGRVLAREHEKKEALATLERALAAAGSSAGLRREVLDLIAEAYRSEGDLASLVAMLEKQRPTDAGRLAQLAALYEEIGRVGDSIATWRRAIAAGRRDVDARLALIRLLQATGDLEAATRETEALVAAAPREPEYVFELCETLVQRGEKGRALAALAKLEQRAGADPDVLGRIADFYERIDEKARAIALLARIAAASPDDPRRIADLGDRHWQQGDKKRASETWARIRALGGDRAENLVVLGETYLDHDLPAEALEALEQAAQLTPDRVAVQKALATALERTATTAGGQAATVQRWDRARAIWETLRERAGSDRNLAREARSHLVTLWGLLRQLEQRAAPLARAFGASPPDLEAGRTLADVQVRLRRLPDATATLRKLVQLAPGDEDGYLALERALVLQHDLGGAIEVLQRLVEVAPARARELWQRMSQYAAESYRDEDAVRFAAKAVELSPDDAEGHRKLAEMYRKRQEDDRAIVELRTAIAKNDRLFAVHFELAEMLLARGEDDEADRLLRRVIRLSPDEEQVARAARLAMQINLGKGTLASLERDLLPASLASPRKSVFRRLLVELYGDLAFPLIQRARHGAPEEAARARKELEGLGARAVKPLLDALGDEKLAEQRVALEILSFVGNRTAGPALVAFAATDAETELRARALVAAGSLRDPALLPRLEALLASRDDAGSVDAVSVAATWAVARTGGAKARPLLERLLARGTPEVRALAALGLGASGERAAAAPLLEVVRAGDAGPLARAGAALALGDLGARDASATVLALAEGGEPLARAAALATLGRLGAHDAEGTIADALFATEPALRAAATAAACALAGGPARHDGELLPIPESRLDVRAIVERRATPPCTGAARVEALAALGPAIVRTAAAAAETSPARARVVAEALSTGGLAPSEDDLRGASGPAAESLRRVIEASLTAVVPAFVRLARHPSAEVRVHAVQLLAGRPDDAAQASVEEALGDADVAVPRAALAALGPGSSARTVRAVAALLAAAPAWSLRVEAAEALGRVADAGADGAARAALEKAARADGYALVREAALRALAVQGRDAAAAVLREARDHDAEPHVRDVARALLE